MNPVRGRSPAAAPVRLGHPVELANARREGALVIHFADGARVTVPFGVTLSAFVAGGLFHHDVCHCDGCRSWQP